MKSNCLVSIIMPVYNTEKYLPKAIKSVLCQTYQNWELICIDDGSNDSSLKILLEYSKNDERIKVYHQENRGVSYSRQKGITLANGSFCSFLDSDDWLEPNIIEYFVELAESTKSEIIWCDLFVNESNVWSFKCEQDSSIMIKKILKQEIWGSLCNKFICMEICKLPDVKFANDCVMWEDMSYLIQLLLKTDKIKYLPIPLYHYRQIGTSLTHQNSSRIMTYEYKKAVSCIEKAFLDNGVVDYYNEELNILKRFVLKDFIDDLRIRDYEMFRNTYPEAYAQILTDNMYPMRLRISAWLINNGISTFIPLVCKIDSLLGRISLLFRKK